MNGEQSQQHVLCVGLQQCFCLGEGGGGGGGEEALKKKTCVPSFVPLLELSPSWLRPWNYDYLFFVWGGGGGGGGGCFHLYPLFGSVCPFVLCAEIFFYIFSWINHLGRGRAYVLVFVCCLWKQILRSPVLKSFLTTTICFLNLVLNE